jgi:chromosome partitioning protein
MARTITIATHKGGVGKTTTSIALSAALARADKACLIVDLDPQGHCGRGLGVEVGEGEPTIGAALTEQPTPIGAIIKETGVEGLHLAPSDVRLKHVMPSLYGRPRREEILRRALAPVRELYDYVVIDTPPYFSVPVEMGIAAADFVIVPIEMGARAADAVTDIADLMSVLKGEDFHAWRILRTKVDVRKTVTNEAVMTGLERYQDKLFKQFIPVSEPLNQAQMVQKDIFSFDPTSTGALAYQALAQELIAYGQETLA